MIVYNENVEICYRVTFQMQVPKSRGPQEANGWAIKEARDIIHVDNWDATKWTPVTEKCEVRPLSSEGRVTVMGMEWVDCEVIIYAQEI